MLVSPLSQIALTNNDVVLMKNSLTKRLKKQERKKTKTTAKPPITSELPSGGVAQTLFKTPSLPNYASVPTTSASSASPSTEDIMSTCTPTINNVIHSDFATPTSSSTTTTIVFGKTRAANSIKRVIQ